MRDRERVRDRQIDRQIELERERERKREREMERGRERANGNNTCSDHIILVINSVKMIKNVQTFKTNSSSILLFHKIL